MEKELFLTHELEVYQKKIHEWEGRDGEYVLIKGDDVHGFFTSYDDALTRAYELFGLEPFLVKQIMTVERTHLITRHVDPCLTSPRQ